jgi:hypothetical protein
MDPSASKATAAVSAVIGLGRKLQSASKATAAVSASAARLKSMVPKSCVGSGSAHMMHRPGPKPPSGPPPQIWRDRSRSPGVRARLKREPFLDREQEERELAADREQGERELAEDHAHAESIAQRMAEDHAHADSIAQRIERDAAARYPAKAAGMARIKAWEDAEDERQEAEALHAEATASDAAEAARKEEDALVEECASAVIHAEDNRYIYRGCGK